MIDSIYTGITGVKSHQTRIDVIANNVANINTTGYKSGRVAFSDVMSQTLSEGTAARAQIAATNPKQTGLGVQVASIDTVQRQGTIQTTGIDTDLAIEGDGMFVLSDGITDFYTRDGTFAFDSTGQLSDPGSGLVVQGNLANEDGSFKSEVENLIVPLDRESKALATTAIELSGNLDVGGSAQVWTATTQFGLPAIIASNPGLPLDLSDLGDSVGLSVTVSEGGQDIASTLTIPTTTPFADLEQLTSKLNSQVNLNDSLKGNVLFKFNDLGQLQLRTKEGGANVSLLIDNADPTIDVVSRLGFGQGQNTGTDAADSILLNDLANVGADLTPGDVVRFSGTKPTGERFDGNFEFQPNSADTVRNLLDVVQSAYGGVTAGIDPQTGRLSLTDAETQDSVVGFDINFSLLDTDAVGSGLFGSNPLAEFSTNTQVFDQKGDTHSLTLNFTKSVVANEWSWVASVNGVTPQAGNEGKAVFNEDGTLKSFDSSDRAALQFTPGDGTPNITIDIGATGTGRLGGLTQFVAPSSMAVREQDGRAAGSLVSINVEGDGGIRGTFTNGDSQVLGRVSLAAFSNSGGLKRAAQNLFMQTESSGQPVVGAAETTVQGSIRSGAIELSNVDLAEEFTNLIVSQRGFQASARSITTSDELMSELVNLKR
jgi:flagellar hook protein FlgE